MIQNHMIPVNIAEAILDPFWDEHISTLAQYEWDLAENVTGQLVQVWCWIRLEWEKRSKQKEIGTFKRTCNIDVSDYDGFMLRGSFSKDVVLKISLQVDGIEQLLIQDIKGSDTFREYCGNFKGNTLEKIGITLESPGLGDCTAFIEWTGVFSEARLETLRFAQPKYSPDWPGYIKDTQEIAFKPNLNLYFDADDLNTIREKIKLPGYVVQMENLRALSKAYLGDFPEEKVYEVSCALHNRYTRDRYFEKEEMDIITGARICAFVGLVDEDKELLKMAVRQALCLAHSNVWHEWLHTVPGTTWEHRAFQNYRTLLACTYVLDWAGDMLTEQGKAFLVNAIANKGLSKIQSTFMQHDYIRGCNQGLYFGWGWIVGQIAVSSLWPHAEEWLDLAKKCLVESIDRYVLKDGGADEGVGYLTRSIAQAILGLQVLARYRGEDVKKYLPDQVSQIPCYIQTLLSTAPSAGSILPLSDGGKVGARPDKEAVALLYKIYQQKEMGTLLSQLMGITSEEVAISPGSVFTIIYGPETLPSPAVKVPVFSKLSYSGLLNSCRKSVHGDIRIHLAGGKAHASHAHEDRGSIILEAYGESLLIDPGMIDYANPLADLYKRAIYHNLTTPGSITGKTPRQINPCPLNNIPGGYGDENQLEAFIDITGAWDASVTSAGRKIISKDPTEFQIIDTFELTTEQPVVFRMNALEPFKKTDRGWVLQRGQVQLTIVPQWEVYKCKTMQMGKDSGGREMYQLALEAQLGTQHVLSTMLEIEHLS